MKLEFFKRREDVPTAATEIVHISVVLQSWAADLRRFAGLSQRGTSCDPLYVVSGSQCTVMEFIRTDCKGSTDQMVRAIGSNVGDVVFIGCYANELHTIVDNLPMDHQ